MLTQTYYLPSGLEAVVIDKARLSLSLYGRRFTVRDDSGLLRLMFGCAIDRKVDLPQLLQEHEGKFPDKFVESVVESLLSSHFLVKKEPNGTDGATSDLLTHVSGVMDPVGTQDETDGETGSWRLGIVGDGSLSRAVQEAVQRNGLMPFTCSDPVEIPEKRRSHTLVVACADNEDHGLFRKVNAAAAAARVPSLYVSVTSQMARVGPIVVPHANACYECYFHRLASTRVHADEFAASADARAVLCRPVPTQLSIEWAVAATISQILSFVSGLDLDLHLGPMSEADALKGEVVKSSLLKLPRCPVCGVGNASRPLRAVATARAA
jgi:bacteriocin biosynthesis cyclodehydratase domain-containing protein